MSLYILLHEPDQSQGNKLVRSLAEEGFVAVLASTTDEALNLIKTQPWIMFILNLNTPSQENMEIISRAQNLPIQPFFIFVGSTIDPVFDPLIGQPGYIHIESLAQEEPIKLIAWQAARNSEDKALMQGNDATNNNSKPARGFDGGLFSNLNAMMTEPDGFENVEIPAIVPSLEVQSVATIEAQPVTEETPAEEPVPEKPVTKQTIARIPTGERPAQQTIARIPTGERPAQQTIARIPTGEHPVVKEPIAEEPVPEKPVTEQPIARIPTGEYPAQQPLVEEPDYEEQVVEEPTDEEPLVEEPPVYEINEYPTQEISDNLADISRTEKTKPEEIAGLNFSSIIDNVGSDIIGIVEIAERIQKAFTLLQKEERIIKELVLEKDGILERTDEFEQLLNSKLEEVQGQAEEILVAVEKERDNALAENKALQEEITGLKVELGAAVNTKSDDVALKQEIARLKTQLKVSADFGGGPEASIKEISRLKAEVTSAKAELTSLKAELTSVKSELTSAESELTSAKTEFKSATDKNLENEDNLLNEITRLKAELKLAVLDAANAGPSREELIKELEPELRDNIETEFNEKLEAEFNRQLAEETAKVRAETEANLSEELKQAFSAEKKALKTKFEENFNSYKEKVETNFNQQKEKLKGDATSAWSTLIFAVGSFVTAIPEPVIAINKAGSIVGVSISFAALIGGHANKLIGKPYATSLPQEMVDYLNKCEEQFIETEISLDCITNANFEESTFNIHGIPLKSGKAGLKILFLKENLPPQILEAKSGTKNKMPAGDLDQLVEDFKEKLFSIRLLTDTISNKAESEKIRAVASDVTIEVDELVTVIDRLFTSPPE
jgi:PAS domain-containing protein